MEIIDYPNYLIYPDGRVYSKPRFGTKGGFLKYGNDGKQGYLSVCLQGKTIKLHTLVAQHYLEDYNEKKQLGFEIDHIDNDILNNNKDNLQMIKSYRNRHKRSRRINNSSGFRNIHKRENGNWRYSWTLSNEKNERINIGNKTFKSKIDAICYKYIMILKYKVLKKNNII